jgi:predicted dehydrogenase
MTLRVGLIGAGHVLAYASAFSQIADTQIVALAALPDDPRRNVAAKKYGIPSVYDTAEALFDKERLDVAVIGSPPRFHRDHACAALEAGCHVLCEKPPAMNVAEAYAMYFRSLSIDRHLEFAMCFRHMRNLPPQRPYLSSVHVRMRRTSAPEGWRQDMATAGGGCLADIGVHALDIGLYALGDPSPVAASGRMTDKDGHDISSGCEATFVGVVETQGGKRISLDISWTAEKDEQVLVCAGQSPAAPPHSGAVADNTPLVVDDDLFLRAAHGFLHNCFAANRAQQLELTARGVVLQRCLDGLYLSAAKGQGVRLS